MALLLTMWYILRIWYVVKLVGSACRKYWRNSHISIFLSKRFRFMFIYMCVCVYIYVCMCMCPYIYIYMCVCVCVCVCVCLNEFWNNANTFLLNRENTWEKVVFTFFFLSSVQFSHSIVSDSLRSHELQHARPPCPSPTPRVHSNSCPSSQWCHPAISSSVVPFSSCSQSLPAAEFFPMSQLFAWGGQSTGVSASASGLAKNTQDWSPSEWTGWISLQSKRLSRVFSNTTLQKHLFFGAQPSSQSNSHIHDHWKNHSLD